MIESNAAPSSDNNEPRLFKFIQYATIHCVAALVETVIVMNLVFLDESDRKVRPLGESKERKRPNCRKLPFIIDSVVFVTTLTGTCCYIGVMHQAMTAQYPERDNDQDSFHFKQYFF